jgi:GNAT superfamily N-acetyltransferase
LNRVTGIQTAPLTNMSNVLSHINPLIKIQTIPAAVTLPLRQIVLRPRRSTRQCQYQGDHDQYTHHFGAFSSDNLVGVASILRESPPKKKNPNSWRLRGMAVLGHAQGIGVGEKLLRACLKHVIVQDGVDLWCYSRISALPFYEKLGFKRKGKVFNFPHVGPVLFMLKSLENQTEKIDDPGKNIQKS